MPPAIKNEFARNPVATISAVIASALALVSLGAVLWIVPAWAAEVDQRLSFNERADSRHHDDKDLHVPYDKQSTRFVTREEWLAQGNARQRQLDDIKKLMERQDAKMDKILDKITSPNGSKQ